jgi:hypothetical protein
MTDTTSVEAREPDEAAGPVLVPDLDGFARGAPEGIPRIDRLVYELGLYELLSAYGDSHRRRHSEIPIVAPPVLYSLDEALTRLGRLVGHVPEWRELAAFLPDEFRGGIFRRSALAATLAAVLELARAEIEAIRGAALARGTLDRQLEAAGCGRRDGAWLRGGRSIGRRPRRFSRISVSTACATCPALTSCAPPGCSISGRHHSASRWRSLRNTARLVNRNRRGVTSDTARAEPDTSASRASFLTLSRLRGRAGWGSGQGLGR